MTRSTGRLMSAAAVLLILVAGAAVFFGAAVFSGASTALTAPLSLLALAVTAARLAMSRARGPVDAVLLACGGLLVTMVLTGLLLGITGIGLHPRSWALGLGLVALVGLSAGEFLERKATGSPENPRGAESTETKDTSPRPTGFSTFGSPGEFGGAKSSQNTTNSGGPTTPDVAEHDKKERWLPRLRNLPWAVAIVAIAVVALTISVRATNNAEVSPLQMAVGSVQSGSAQIVVSSDEDSGRLELRTEAPDGTSLSYPLFSVAPGKPVSTSVVLPSKGRFVITLNNPDQSKPLRSLILDR